MNTIHYYYGVRLLYYLHYSTHTRSYPTHLFSTNIQKADQTVQGPTHPIPQYYTKINIMVVSKERPKASLISRPTPIAHWSGLPGTDMFLHLHYLYLRICLHYLLRASRRSPLSLNQPRQTSASNALTSVRCPVPWNQTKNEKTRAHPPGTFGTSRVRI